jgi:hypothetical protein
MIEVIIVEERTFFTCEPMPNRESSFPSIANVPRILADSIIGTAQIAQKPDIRSDCPRAAHDLRRRSPSPCNRILNHNCITAIWNLNSCMAWSWIGDHVCGRIGQA